MSVIDCFPHEVLGFIYHYDGAWLPIYRIHENILSHSLDFIAKAGDILIGGGGGEAEALVIDMEKAINFNFEKRPGFLYDHSYYKHFWSVMAAYRFGCEFKKFGWNENFQQDTWIVDNVFAWVWKNYPEYEIDVEHTKNSADEFMIIPDFIDFPPEDYVSMTNDWRGKNFK